MSQSERDRLVVLRQVQERMLTMTDAALRLKLGTRQMRRLMRRFEAEGDSAVIHRARGRPSNACKLPALKQRVLQRARDPLFHDFGPTLLAEHLALDTEIGFIHPDTLRRWLIEAGLWKSNPRKLRHRRRRERRAARGELVLMDTSVHPWLEQRSSEEIVLIAIIDDATSELFASFVSRDTGAANRQVIVDYIQRHGRFGALYADRASHFGNRRRNRSRSLSLDEREAEMSNSIIRQALEALGSELIIALSPQAKGRVERLFKTLQDRLLKELRVAGICTLEAANEFLQTVFIPFWNQRFTVEPAQPVDAYRALEDSDLDVLFAETETRVIGFDFTFRYYNRRLQIEQHEADAGMPKQRITIETRLDGSVHYHWKDRYLSPVPFTPPPRRVPEKPQRSAHAPRPQPADHPWRRFPVVVGRALDWAPEPIVAYAPAALQPGTPAQDHVFSKT